MINSTILTTKLKELRKKNNYSQTYVAEYLNISRQAISRWETGKATPDLDNLLLLAKLYNVPVDELFDKSNTNSPSQTADFSDPTNSSASVLEMIGLSVVLILSTQFPFAPMIISVFIAFWMKKNNRNYFVVYILCVICLLIGIYNTYIFFIHFMPNTGISTIDPV